MMKFLSFVVLIGFFFSACSWSDSHAQKTEPKFKAWSEVESKDAPAKSSDYNEAELLGTIKDESLQEISGLVASRANPGVFWVHNDSGDKARIYAIDARGKLLAKFKVTGAENEDWEDIASGPGKDGNPALYIADTGNNDGNRTNLVVYRVTEPKLSGAKKSDTEPAEAFPFSYPDGNHDCEAIFVNPADGQIFLITKTMKSDCGVYRFPLPLRAGEKVVLEKVSGKQIKKIAQLRLVTGASIAPDGMHIVIRTYFAAFELQREKGKPLETFFDHEPSLITMPLLKQAEAIAYTADGKALVTTTEKIPAPLYQIKHK